MHEILSDVGLFIKERGGTAQEVIILKFSHYYNRDKKDWNDAPTLIEATKKALDETVKDYLFIKAPTDRLTNLSLNQIAPVSGDGKSPSCRIIAVFDEMTATAEDHRRGFYSYANLGDGAADLVVFDEYSDTNKINDMINGQMGQYENISNHAGDLFLLSWTLTPDGTEEFFGSAPVERLAGQANPTLMPEMLQQVERGNLKEGILPNVLYVDFADTFVTDVAVSLNTYLKMIPKLEKSNASMEKVYV
jgi:hypothetical protein